MKKNIRCVTVVLSGGLQYETLTSETKEEILANQSYYLKRAKRHGLSLKVSTKVIDAIEKEI